MKQGYLGLLNPLLYVLEDDMVNVVRSTWQTPDLELPGLLYACSGSSDAPMWGADTSNFGRLALVEVCLDGHEDSFDFGEIDEGALGVNFHPGAALAYVLALLTIADVDAVEKLNKVAFYSEEEFARNLPTIWLPPDFVYLRFFSEVASSKLAWSTYLFESAAYPEFEDKWLDVPEALLGELKSAASEFERTSSEFLDPEGIYSGPRVQPLWMQDYDPKNSRL